MPEIGGHRFTPNTPLSFKPLAAGVKAVQIGIVERSGKADNATIVALLAWAFSGQQDGMLA